MNSELLRKIADRIERYPDSYDQNTYGRAEEGCGTVCCIAGHTLIESGYIPAKLCFDLSIVYIRPVPLGSSKVSSVLMYYFDIAKEAKELLDLTDEEEYLFSPHWRPRNGQSVADALREMAETDKLVTNLTDVYTDPFPKVEEDGFCRHHQFATTWDD